jgi:hypothetical protein
MAQQPDIFIESLVNDLKPLRPLRPQAGLRLAVFALLTGVGVLSMLLQLRPDIKAGQPDSMFLTSSGLFLVLALASAWAALDMARPYVGSRRSGWGWTALMAAVLPVAALGVIATSLMHGHAVDMDWGGIECLLQGCGIGLITATTLVLWLRRGAPSRPERAGLLTGVASGAAGIFAVSLVCPSNDLIHIGIWHGGTVIVMGVMGRFGLRPLLTW